MSVLVFILILSFLVIIHELGHLLAAFWAKIKVEEFGLGYPPLAKTLFTWRKVPFTLNWIPFGGFVRMEGEEAPDEEAATKHKGLFYTAPIGKRLVVILAGATVNFIFGILAFSVVYSILGIPTPITGARIEYVAPSSPAEASKLPIGVNITGMQVGSEVTAISKPADVISFVEQHRGETVKIITTGNCKANECDYMQQEFSARIRTAEETPAGQGALGVAFQSYEITFYPWWQMPFRGVAYGLKEAFFLGGTILNALKSLGTDLFTKGQLPSELAGPVGIVHQAHEVGLVSLGWAAVVGFAGQLSINLAIMNILPIPPLDGGKAFLTILETVISRKRLHRLEYLLNYVGYIFLLLLIVTITIRDVVRWVFPQ
jgi:regulator of sigma E protease